MVEACLAPKQLHKSLEARYGLVHELERRIVDLVAEIEDNTRRVKLAKQDASSARAEKEQAAVKLPIGQRAKRVALEKVSRTEKELHVQETNIKEGCQTNKGLQRSLLSLQARLHNLQNGVILMQEEAAQVVCEEDTSQITKESLLKSIADMEALNLKLTRRLEAEREKRLKLKAAVRAEFGKFDANHRTVEEHVSIHETNLDVWKANLAVQDARKQEAARELAEMRERASIVDARVGEHRELRMQMHRELMEMQRVHERLRSDLDHVLQDLEKISQCQAESRKRFCSNHLEAIDARIERSGKREWDQEIPLYDERFAACGSAVKGVNSDS